MRPGVLPCLLRLAAKKEQALKKSQIADDNDLGEGTKRSSYKADAVAAARHTCTHDGINPKPNNTRRPCEEPAMRFRPGQSEGAGAPGRARTHAGHSRLASAPRLRRPKASTDATPNSMHCTPCLALSALLHSTYRKHCTPTRR